MPPSKSKDTNKTYSNIGIRSTQLEEMDATDATFGKFMAGKNPSTANLNDRDS